LEIAMTGLIRIAHCSLVVAFLCLFLPGCERSKTPQEIEDEKQVQEQTPVDFTLDDLIKDYRKVENRASFKYNGTVLQVTGAVARVYPDHPQVQMTIREPTAGGASYYNIIFHFHSSETKSVKPLTVGEQVTIKGVCWSKQFENVELKSCKVVR
jgi:tRNA_anti-like